MWPFKNRLTPDQLLLDRFLQIESDRLTHRSDLEAKREELEVKKLEIELSHLEARTKAQIELEAAQQELRLKKREAGKRGAQKRRALARPDAQGCPLCADINYRHVTIPMIEAHRAHEAPQPVEQGN